VSPSLLCRRVPVRAHGQRQPDRCAWPAMRRPAVMNGPPWWTGRPSWLAGNAGGAAAAGAGTRRSPSRQPGPAAW